VHGASGANEGDGRQLQRTISHNLRTPLAVIKGCTDMLLAHGDDAIDPERRRELLEVASQNVDRLAEAIAWLEGELAALTKPETITLDEPDPVDRPAERA
jgi:K+-sensing histidine kinase KdpD